LAQHLPTGRAPGIRLKFGLPELIWLMYANALQNIDQLQPASLIDLKDIVVVHRDDKASL